MGFVRSLALADLFTFANLACGAGAILSLMKALVTGEDRWVVLACVLIPVALVMDTLDGRVARWRRRYSAVGADLDSLADAISFGMAPAALGFALGLQGGLDVAALLLFVACGVGRLARFNVTASSMSDGSGKVSHFEGLPIPTSVGIVLLWAVLLGIGRTGDAIPLGSFGSDPLLFHPFSLIYVLHGLGMISGTLRIPKL
jgi:CDP-diacylglycerol--serine O-phosphatidyltransferase